MKILKEKKFYLHQFPLIDQCSVVSDNKLVYPLRFFSGNELLDKKCVDQVINYILENGKIIYEKCLD